MPPGAGFGAVVGAAVDADLLGAAVAEVGVGGVEAGAAPAAGALVGAAGGAPPQAATSTPVTPAPIQWKKRRRFARKAVDRNNSNPPVVVGGTPERRAPAYGSMCARVIRDLAG